jgi:large subunit ribosomal protein L10
LKRQEKQAIVENLRERLGRSQIVILTDYKGLDVTAINDLRRRLREANVEYQVVKNTLLARASEETDIALIKENFKGPTAIALSYDDPVSPAKVLIKFADENKKLEIKVGVLNGKVLDMNAIKALSALPSREVLLSKVLSVMNGVPTAFVRAMNDIPRRLLNVLQAVKAQKEAA